MNLDFTKPQNLGSLLMKSSQSNCNLGSPGSYLVCSYLITTVTTSLIELLSNEQMASELLKYSKRIKKPPSFSCRDSILQEFQYTRSLAPADFSGAVFTCLHFQIIAQISSLCDFHYTSEGIPSLMRFWLVIT